jgi:hypothetical protein
LPVNSPRWIHGRISKKARNPHEFSFVTTSIPFPLCLGCHRHYVFDSSPDRCDSRHPKRSYRTFRKRVPLDRGIDLQCHLYQLNLVRIDWTIRSWFDPTVWSAQDHGYLACSAGHRDCDLVGTTLSGWLSDRFSNRWLLFFYYGLRGLSLLVLPWSFDLQSFKLPLFAVFYGLDWIATVPPTVALTAQIFGRDRVGLVFGWIFAAHQLGAATAASFAGTLRTFEGSYDHAFLISGNLCVIAAVSILFIGIRPSRVTGSGRLAVGGAEA